MKKPVTILWDRRTQVVLILSAFGFSWLAMMAVHEFGHILHAWTSGGEVERVVLDPLSFSRTDLSDNPQPLFVAWGGPLWGCILPLIAHLGIRWSWRRIAYLSGFFAGFCLVANGAYIGGGSFTAAGDAGQMLQHGSPTWLLILFGIVAVSAGLWFWHGLGRHFGVGSGKQEVRRADALAMTSLFLLILVAELAAAMW